MVSEKDRGITISSKPTTVLDFNSDIAEKAAIDLALEISKSEVAALERIKEQLPKVDPVKVDEWFDQFKKHRSELLSGGVKMVEIDSMSVIEPVRLANAGVGPESAGHWIPKLINGRDDMVECNQNCSVTVDHEGTVTVKDCDGNILRNGLDYTVHKNEARFNDLVAQKAKTYSIEYTTLNDLWNTKASRTRKRTNPKVCRSKIRGNRLAAKAARKRQR